ncbi:hypothetical protein Ancab_008464 [Ancistrocladus abbreviatus]
MFLQLGRVPTVVVSSSAMAKEVMKTHDQVTASRPKLYSPKHLFFDCKDLGFSPYGPHWRHLRKITTLELLSTTRVQSYDVFRKEQVSRLVERIEASCHGPINLSKLLRLHMYDVLCRVILGKNFSEKGFDEFTRLLLDLLEGLGAFNFSDFFPKLEFLDILAGHKSKLQKIFWRWDNFLNEIINERQDSDENNSKEKDFVKVLLQIHKGGSGDIPLTMTSVKAIITVSC